WQTSLQTSCALIEVLDEEIAAQERALRRLGADHRYVRLLTSCPGIAWVLGYTIAAELGDIGRFRTPAKLVSYTGLCPRVRQSGEVDRRGRLSKQGPPVPALGAHRGRPQRDPLRRRLPRALGTHTGAARQAAWRQDRGDHGRPQAERGDLVDAQPQPTVCSGRRQALLDRVTVLLCIAPPEQLRPG